MERNESFVVSNLIDLVVHLAWAQIEIFADDIERVQVLAAGDENSVRDLRIEVKENMLLVEQPQYGLSINITDSHWMQVCIRIPKTWSQKIHINTIGGLLNARGLQGSRVVLDTVSGDVRAARITACELSMKSISGDVRADILRTDSLSVRTVSGNIALDDVTARIYKCTTVNGEQKVKHHGHFEMMDMRSVTGDVTLMTTANRLNVSMRSLSGRVSTSGVELTEDAGVPSVRATGVSADLKLIYTAE